MYGSKYNWKSTDMIPILETCIFLICFRKEKPVGFLVAQRLRSFFDKDILIMKQVILYGLTNTRASYLLLKAFIDIGRNSANHVITMIGEKTNIKPKTLERLGFKAIETIYRLET